MFYKLDNKKPVKCASGQEWAEWYETAAISGQRIVARDELDGLVVSTIFTGIDPNPASATTSQPPLLAPELFETMLFLNGTASGMTVRSRTWKQAEHEHRRVLKNAREWTAKDDDFPIPND